MHTTALHSRQRALGAKMTDFHGWEMALYYTSIIEEHQAVRETFGVFDISHMGQVVVEGPDAVQTLERLMVSEISQVGEGHACYTLMLNEAGGVLDDLIIYRIGRESFLIIVNCGNRTSDVEWLTAHRQGSTTITDISDGRSILAIQGPLACRLLEQILDARVTSLGRFEAAPIRTMGPAACIARTGYTGSDGFELFLPNHHAQGLWDALLSTAAGGLPVGLGARDTLRIEAGLRLYGSDMDTTTTPYEAGLGWTVAINKPEFIGKDVLVRQKQDGLTRRFIGFELPQGPVPRAGCVLQANGRQVGTVTSGTYSPILNKPLGMGYVETDAAAVGSTIHVVVRDKSHAGTIVRLPFWKRPAQKKAVQIGEAATKPLDQTSKEK